MILKTILKILCEDSQQYAQYCQTESLDCNSKIIQGVCPKKCGVCLKTCKPGFKV